jgi:hypothetical protein
LFNRIFGRFIKRGVQKHDKIFFHKSPSGLITKKVAFVSSVSFSPSVVLLDCFYRVFGRFVTSRVQNRDYKKSQKFFRSRQSK